MWVLNNPRKRVIKTSLDFINLLFRFTEPNIRDIPKQLVLSTANRMIILDTNTNWTSDNWSDTAEPRRVCSWIRHVMNSGVYFGPYILTIMIQSFWARTPYCTYRASLLPCRSVPKLVLSFTNNPLQPLSFSRIHLFQSHFPKIFMDLAFHFFCGLRI